MVTLAFLLVAVPVLGAPVEQERSHSIEQTGSGAPVVSVTSDAQQVRAERQVSDGRVTTRFAQDRPFRVAPVGSEEAQLNFLWWQHRNDPDAVVASADTGQATQTRQTPRSAGGATATGGTAPGTSATVVQETVVEGNSRVVQSLVVAVQRRIGSIFNQAYETRSQTVTAGTNGSAARHRVQLEGMTGTDARVGVDTDAIAHGRGGVATRSDIVGARQTPNQTSQFGLQFNQSGEGTNPELSQQVGVRHLPDGRVVFDDQGNVRGAVAQASRQASGCITHTHVHGNENHHGNFHIGSHSHEHTHC